MIEIRKVHGDLRIDLGIDICNKMDIKKGDFVIVETIEIDNQKFIKITPAKVIPRSG